MYIWLECWFRGKIDEMVHQRPIGLTQDIDDTFVHGLEQS